MGDGVHAVMTTKEVVESDLIEAGGVCSTISSGIPRWYGIDCVGLAIGDSRLKEEF